MKSWKVGTHYFLLNFIIFVTDSNILPRNMYYSSVAQLIYQFSTNISFLQALTQIAEFLWIKITKNHV